MEVDTDLETYRTTDKFMVRMMPSRGTSAAPLPPTVQIPSAARASLAAPVLSAALVATDLSHLLRNAEALGKERALTKDAEDALLLAEAKKFQDKTNAKAKGKAAAKGPPKKEDVWSIPAAAPASTAETAKAEDASAEKANAAAPANKFAKKDKPAKKTGNGTTTATQKVSRKATRRSKRLPKGKARRQPGANAAAAALDGDTSEAIAGEASDADAAPSPFATPEASSARVLTLSGAGTLSDGEELS
jgi:hypothetical protein